MGATEVYLAISRQYIAIGFLALVGFIGLAFLLIVVKGILDQRKYNKFALPSLVPKDETPALDSASSAFSLDDLEEEITIVSTGDDNGTTLDELPGVDMATQRAPQENEDQNEEALPGLPSLPPVSPVKVNAPEPTPQFVTPVAEPTIVAEPEDSPEPVIAPEPREEPEPAVIVEPAQEAEPVTPPAEEPSSGFKMLKPGFFKRKAGELTDDNSADTATNFDKIKPSQATEESASSADGAEDASISKPLKKATPAAPSYPGRRRLEVPVDFTPPATKEEN